MSSATLTVAGYMRKAERALDEARLLLRDEKGSPHDLFKTAR